MPNTCLPGYSTFVQSRVKWLSSFQEDLLHAAMGLCGESIELYFHKDGPNAKEELGDLCFYLEHMGLAIDKWNYSQTIGAKWVEQRTFADKMAEGGQPERALVYLGGEILDMAKKAYIYGKDPKSLPLIFAWKTFDDVLYQTISSWYGDAGSRRQCEAENQAKLILRYPTGYTDQAAQARADKLEEPS